MIMFTIWMSITFGIIFSIYMTEKIEKFKLKYKDAIDAIKETIDEWDFWAGTIGVVVLQMEKK